MPVNSPEYSKTFRPAVDARTWSQEARERRVVQREHVVLLRFGVEDVLHFLELVRHLGREVIRLRDVLVRGCRVPTCNR